MKVIAVLSLLPILGTAGSATPPPSTTAAEVPVCLDSIAQASTSITYPAQLEASKLLGLAAVQVVWIHGKSCRSSAAIQVHFTVETPDNLLPGALAFCQPTARDDIRVLYDRVQSIAIPEHQAHLLAYVLVHEIVHILEGEARHSSTGIMKAEWTPADYAAIASGEMTFAAEDLELVRKGTIDRQARVDASLHKSNVEIIR